MSPSLEAVRMAVSLTLRMASMDCAWPGSESSGRPHWSKRNRCSMPSWEPTHTKEPEPTVSTHSRSSSEECEPLTTAPARKSKTLRVPSPLLLYRKPCSGA